VAAIGLFLVRACNFVYPEVIFQFTGTETENKCYQLLELEVKIDQVK